MKFPSSHKPYSWFGNQFYKSRTGRAPHYIVYQNSSREAGVHIPACWWGWNEDLSEAKNVGLSWKHLTNGNFTRAYQYWEKADYILFYSGHEKGFRTRVLMEDARKRA